jgi:hypothetical protein
MIQIQTISLVWMLFGAYAIGAIVTPLLFGY